MRTIEDHKVNPVNDALSITVTDDPGFGGASHRYVVAGFDNTKNLSRFTVDEPVQEVVILFQNGGAQLYGVNGITQEVLLAIVADRLECFQKGQFAHPANAEALEHITKAREALMSRTNERISRGVEGTHTV